VKRSSFVTAALAFLAPIGMARAQTPFTQYTSPDGAFTVLFPGTPEVSAPDVLKLPDGTSMTGRSYHVQTDDADYQVATTDYPTDKETADLTVMPAVAAQSCAGTYAIGNRDTFQGHPAARFQVNCPAQADLPATVLVVQAVVIGKRLYRVMYGATKVDPDRSSTFLNSLHIN
jgi:hypothetical protein